MFFFCFFFFVTPCAMESRLLAFLFMSFFFVTAIFRFTESDSLSDDIPLKQPIINEENIKPDEENFQVSAEKKVNKETTADEADDGGAKGLQFTKHVYITNIEKTKFSKNFEIPFEAALLNVKKEVKLAIEDAGNKKDLSSFIEVSEKNGKVSVTITKDIPEEVIKQLNQLIFILKAISEEETCYTTLILNLIKSNVPASLKFEQEQYELNVLTEQRGIIGQYEAVLKNKENAAVKYKLHLENEELTKSLIVDENKGTLSIINSLPIGTISAKIEAYVVDDNTLKAETKVQLKVTHTAVCGSNSIRFSYALMTKHVPIEKIIENIVEPSTVHPNCVYNIISQHPEGDYFALDKNSGSLSLIKPIPAATPIFDDLAEPSFILETGVSCTADEPLHSTLTSAPMINEIKYEPRRMLIKIIVDDVYNRPPTFEQTEVVYGYPAEFNFIKHHPPPALATVQVTANKHSSDNSKIRYSILESEKCPFTIHPITGTIYPWKYHGGNHDVSFTVVANKAGTVIKSDDMHKGSQLKVLVKFLNQAEIVEVIYKEGLLEDVPQILKKFSTKTEYEVKSLFSAVIPYNEKVHKFTEISTQASSSPPHLLRLLVYGLRESTVLNGEQLSRKLEKIENVLMARPIPQQTVIFIKGQEYSIFTISIVFLGVSLIVSLVALKFLYIRHYIKNHDRNSNVPLNEDIESISHSHWISPQYSTFRAPNNATPSPLCFASPTHNEGQHCTPNQRMNNAFIQSESEDTILVDYRQNSMAATTTDNSFLPSYNSLSTFKTAPSNGNNRQQNQTINVATIALPRNSSTPVSNQDNVEQHSAVQPATIPSENIEIIRKPEQHTKKVIKP